MKENLPVLQISDAIGGATEATSIYINQIVYDMRRAGYDPTALSLGEAYFDIPLFDFAKLDIEKGYHYSDSRGIPELRNKIADFYSTHYNATVNGHDEILITAGSKPVIFLAMLTALNPGDEVAIHEPCWLSYPDQARFCGGVPVQIPYFVEPEDFADYYSDRTRMLIINNPNNPSGKVYSAEELSSLYATCRDRGIYLLVDEAYSDFVIDEPFVSAAKLVPDKDGLIVVNSLSKNMGMSGWRIGYAISHPTFISQLLKANQHIVTCAPTVLMQYCNRYFDDILLATLPQARAVVEKRHRVGEMMDELNLERLDGNATFYFFLSIGDFPGTSSDLAMHLLVDKFIAVVPGSAYGNSTERFVRLSIGTESEERIWEALQVFKTAINNMEFEPIDHEAKLEALQLSR
jgi:aspartate/methionine/tyrosine aminotransferase